MGRILLTVGIVLVVAGLLLTALERAGLRLGHLPGDIVWRGKHGTFLAPLGTSLFLSIALSILLTVIARLRR